VIVLDAGPRLVVDVRVGFLSRRLIDVELGLIDPVDGGVGRGVQTGISANSMWSSSAITAPGPGG
jgi:hypothetical protein